MDITHQKNKAAEMAVACIQSGMVIGLGGGSTSLLAVRYLAEQLQSGRLKDILGVPCSTVIGQAALRLGIPLTTLEEHPVLDLTIDGADEVDPQLNLIKGGGGALLREKIVAQASHREIIVVDESKLSSVLGMQWAVPVEVIPFGWGLQAAFLQSLGAKIKVRKNLDSSDYLTDQGNLILDCDFGLLPNPENLARLLEGRAGIVEHGLFIGLANEVIVAGAEGCQRLVRK
jgi:ribose 5-phosphate isomerase A